MRILHGRYVAEGTEQVVHLSDMNRQKYRNQFKGKLYCPTEGCTALLSYSAGKKVYFKTWRLCHHSVDCMYHGKQVGFTSWQEDAKVTMSGNRKHNALQHAAKLFGGDRDKKARNVEQDRVSRLAKKQKNRQMALYDDLLVDELVVKESVIRK